MKLIVVASILVSCCTLVMVAAQSAAPEFSVGSVVANDANGELVLASRGTITSVQGVVTGLSGSVSVAPSAGVPLTSSGIAEVIASTADGDIRNGDYVSVSNIPGVVTHAGGSTFVVGTAVESLLATGETDAVGRIQIIVDIGIREDEGILGLTAPAPVQNVANFLAGKEVAPARAIGALLSVILTCAISGLMYVGLVRGAHASMSRNPDSKPVVRATQNTLISVVVGVFLSGLLISYLLLRTA